MEQSVAYVTNESKQSVPRDLFNFWRRVLRLPRGRVYSLILSIPESEDEQVTWTFIGDGKVENGR